MLCRGPLSGTEQCTTYASHIAFCPTDLSGVECVSQAPSAMCHVMNILMTTDDYSINANMWWLTVLVSTHQTTDVLAESGVERAHPTSLSASTFVVEHETCISTVVPQMSNQLHKDRKADWHTYDACMSWRN